MADPDAAVARFARGAILGGGDREFTHDEAVELVRQVVVYNLANLADGRNSIGWPVFFMQTQGGQVYRDIPEATMQRALDGAQICQALGY